MRHFEEHKTSLTPGEKLRVAHACLIWGWDDHKVAQLMNVNPARVSDLPRVPILHRNVMTCAPETTRSPQTA